MDKRTKALLEKLIEAKEQQNTLCVTLTLNSYEANLIYYLLKFLQETTTAEMLDDYVY
ncbi:MAG: hypothetical protein FWB72_01365 [Firmicutes bacterium]|nr:hypothetical protein [Bacillota bacterium]